MAAVIAGVLGVAGGGAVRFGSRAGGFVAGSLFFGGELVNRRIDHPTRELVRNGTGGEVRVLFDEHRHAEQAQLVDRLHIDRHQPFARFLCHFSRDRLGRHNAGCNFGQLVFAEQLGLGEIAHRRGAAGSDAHEFSEHGESAAENGNGQHHLQ